MSLPVKYIYQKSVVTRQMDRKTQDEVIPRCRYAKHKKQTRKVTCIIELAVKYDLNVFFAECI